MAIIANILIGIGFTTYAFTCLWLLIIASEKHILRVPACIFIPLASLIFVLLNWEETRNPFLLKVAASVFLCTGFGLMPN